MAKKKATAWKHGDAVTWNSSQGEIEGTVERVVTKPTQVKGHLAEATPDAPEVLVRSAKTGAEAVHRPEGLHKRPSHD